MNLRRNSCNSLIFGRVGKLRSTTILYPYLLLHNVCLHESYTSLIQIRDLNLGHNVNHEKRATFLARLFFSKKKVYVFITIASASALSMSSASLNTLQAIQKSFENRLTCFCSAFESQIKPNQIVNTIGVTCN